MPDIMSSTLSHLANGKRGYERLVWGLMAIGCLGLVVGILTDERLIGTVLYLVAVWTGTVMAFGLPYVSETNLYDERDVTFHNRASGLTIGITFVVSIGAIPALYVLDAGGTFEIPPRLWGAILLASALGLLYGACYTVVSRRY